MGKQLRAIASQSSGLACSRALGTSGTDLRGASAGPWPYGGDKEVMKETRGSGMSDGPQFWS